MDADSCDANHLDSDVLLPPRKRHLAGMKKQDSFGNSSHSSSISTMSEFDQRLNSLLRSHLSDPNASTEEIVEASRSEAVAAIQVAATARAAAEEKAVIASKALAAAKNALELVAAMSDEATSSERYSRKIKMKKQFPVEMLYEKRQAKNCRTDEELARRLHQAMNSSPRISGHPSTSEFKGNRNKRLKGLSIEENTRVLNRGIMWEGYTPTTSNGNVVAAEVNSEGSIHVPPHTVIRVDGIIPKFNNAGVLMIDNGEAHTSQSMDKSDDTCSVARKRGRIKQKKLLLSNCTIRDQENPKGEQESESSPTTEETNGKPISNERLLLAPHPMV